MLTEDNGMTNLSNKMMILLYSYINDFGCILVDVFKEKYSFIEKRIVAL